jgi:hypothetical protein
VIFGPQNPQNPSLAFRIASRSALNLSYGELGGRKVRHRDACTLRSTKSLRRTSTVHGERTSGPTGHWRRGQRT